MDLGSQAMGPQVHSCEEGVLFSLDLSNHGGSVVQREREFAAELAGSAGISNRKIAAYIAPSTMFEFKVSTVPSSRAGGSCDEVARNAHFDVQFEFGGLKWLGEKGSWSLLQRIDPDFSAMRVRGAPYNFSNLLDTRSGVWEVRKFTDKQAVPSQLLEAVRKHKPTCSSASGIDYKLLAAELTEVGYDVSIKAPEPLVNGKNNKSRCLEVLDHTYLVCKVGHGSAAEVSFLAYMLTSTGLLSHILADPHPSTRFADRAGGGAAAEGAV